MARQDSKGVAGAGRRVLVWALRCSLLLVMAIAAGVLYLRWAGAPHWLKHRLEAELRERGVAIQVEDIQFRGLQVIARNLSLKETQTGPGLAAIIAEMALRLDGTALQHGELRPSSVVLRGGQIEWPLANSHAPLHYLSLENVAVVLRARSTNQWELERLDGRVLGAEIHAFGAITNVAALRDWFPKKVAGQPRLDWRSRLDPIVAQLAGCSFTEPSVLNLNLHADGRDSSTLQLNVELNARAAVWQGGGVENVRALLTTLPSVARPGETEARLKASTEALSMGEMQGHDLQITSQGLGSISQRLLRELSWNLQVASFQSRSMTGRTLIATGLTVPQNEPQPLRTVLALKGEEIGSRWGTALTNELSLTLLHGWSPVHPWEAEWRLSSGPAHSIWGQTARAQLSGRVAPRATSNFAPSPDPSLGFWACLLPYELQWQCQVEDVQSPKLEIHSASGAGRWSAPEMTLESLRADLYGGEAQTSARLDVNTREVQGDAAFDFDVHRISSLLTTNSQRWLKQYAWQTPPKVSAEWRLQLPAWTNSRPQWRDEVMPTIQLVGQFAGTDASFRGMLVAYARSHFTLTNMVWHLPDLLVKRPDSEATLEYRGDMGTHDFQWHIDGRVDPRALEPLLQEEEAARRILHQLDFATAPTVQGDVWGRWHQIELLGCNGRIAATNFIFRGELCTELTSGILLTNSVLDFTDLIIKQDTQQITVPRGSFDVTERVMYVTNALSTMDPDLFTRVIGPKVRAALRPYKFAKPPTIRVSGRLPTFDIEDADVRFEVAGEDFHYWKFRVPTVSGDVHWRGDNLAITNLQASFYGGQMNWWGQFDFSVPVGAQLRFAGAVQNADLHSLMIDLGRKTNNVQGALDVELHITGADSDDWRSWQGSGRVEVRNGFLWDFPIFGFVSPVLNTFSPGLGNSAISAGHATFTIDDSVVQTSDLELKSPALRLDYTGSVDFQGKVDARMQAEILRDAWGVGRVVSALLWPISKAFAYRISGTVYHPKSEPVYIPKALLHILHPFKSAKKVLGLSPAEPAYPSAAEEILGAPGESR
jgi:hypothetical protein